ncbi:cytochrome P450 2C20-like isoform X2 [Pituophis catenifer annectens]|uniref:cytochrome P450 2C20-like isoform X2 n=1 Tax=Pituophis catenifer annectens TaxID=94852 RepID=UPI0039935FF4
MELTWAGVLLLLCIFFILFSSFQMYKKKRQLPPGPTPWPILGNLFQRDVLPLYKHYQKLADKYGPVFTVWNGSIPMIALCGYEVVKDALVDHSEEFGGRIDIPAVRRIFQNKGLTTTDEKKWRELRRFTLSTLRDFEMGKKKKSERVQEEALCLVEEIATTKGQPFNPRRIFASAVSNVICAVIFGNRFDYKDKAFIEKQKIIESQIRHSVSFLGMVYNTFPKIVEFFPGPHKNIFAEIESICDYIREKVDLHQKTLDPQNLRDYIDCFLLRLEKEQNPSEAKVQQEIDEVIGSNRTPSMEDRLKMPFTNAVIHEVQRHQNGTLETYPRATTCDIKLHGYTIPKCMAIVPVFSSVHFDPLHWETPEKFNPNHFLDENGQFRKKDAFMPFSAGKRACPGEALARMELFLFFSAVLQNFTFSLVGDTKDTDVMSFLKDFRNNQYPLIRAVKRSADTCGQ